MPLAAEVTHPRPRVCGTPHGGSYAARPRVCGTPRGGSYARSRRNNRVPAGSTTPSTRRCPRRDPVSTAKTAVTTALAEFDTASTGRTPRLRTPPLRTLGHPAPGLRGRAAERVLVLALLRGRAAERVLMLADADGSKIGRITRAEAAKALAKVATPCNPRASSTRHSEPMRTFPVGTQTRNVRARLYPTRHRARTRAHRSTYRASRSTTAPNTRGRADAAGTIAERNGEFATATSPAVSTRKSRVRCIHARS